LSPFHQPSPRRRPGGKSYQALFRQRVLVARHAAGAYRESEMTAVWCATRRDGRCFEAQKFACTTRRADEAGASFEMRDLSFVFELFELNSASLRRTEDLADIWNDFIPGIDDCDEADEEGWERPLPKKDFVTEALRLAYAGPPHFAARDDLGDDEENLVWAATVRAGEDGLVEAMAPAPPGLALPVDSGCDYESKWLRQFRLVVTAVRDTDAKMCQIVDVRGWKAGQQAGASDGFHAIGYDTESGGADVRVVDCDGDGDLDAWLYFGHERAPHAFDELPGRLERISLEWKVTYAESVSDETGGGGKQRAIRAYLASMTSRCDATVASKLATLHWI
jgi:hypothetical protein